MQPTDASDAHRLDAARKAARAVGLALRARRLYAAGHALLQQALLSARDALHAYVTVYGPLSCIPAGRGIVFDFPSRPQEDDAVAELGRSLSAAGVGAVRFLAMVTAEEIAAAVDILYLPRATVSHAGGAGKMLMERGVHAVSLEDLAAPSPGPHPAVRVNPLVDLLRSAPEQLASRFYEVSEGSLQDAVSVLQALDQTITTWPRPDRDAAWSHIASAVLATSSPLRSQLCHEIVRRAREPWAASIAARWPPVLVEGILGTGPGRPADTSEIAAFLRALHRGAPVAQMPEAAPVARSTRESGRDALAVDDASLRPYAFARFLGALSILDATRFEEGVKWVERDLAAAVKAEDIDTVGRVLSGLASLTRLPDVRGELARSALHRMLSTAVRDLVARSLSQMSNERHPLRQALATVPDESVPLLLELLADEERIHVRREIIALLASLSHGHLPQLAARLADDRWYVVRNVVTTLGQMHDPAILPYLKVSLRHADVRVRKEALAALGELRTAEAVAMLADALHHQDAETRAAAAHWYNVARAHRADS